MARTNLPATTLAPNGSIAAPAGTTIDQPNGMNVTIPTASIPATPDLDHLFLIVNNSAAATHNVIVRAGVGGGATPGPAFRSAIGDLTVSIATTATRWIGPLDPSRFVQLDGSLNVDFDSGTTGTITAVLMPTRW